LGCLRGASAALYKILPLSFKVAGNSNKRELKRGFASLNKISPSPSQGEGDKGGEVDI